jgi:hypothetical protein
MQKMKSRAAMALVGTLMLLGAATTSAGAADSGWIGSSLCFNLDGCAIITTLGSNGSLSDDGGCAGDVGQKIRYTSGGTTWISGLKWGTTWVAQYASNTNAFRAYH